MKNKEIIIQVSEGLGNQLFMYAHGFSLSKKLGYKVSIDSKNGFNRRKNLLRKHQQYLLDRFTLGSQVIKDNTIINNYFNNTYKKFMLFLDKYKKRKSFYIENQKKINGYKIINQMTEVDSYNLADKIYVIGNFENQDYFKKHRYELIKNLTIKDRYLNLNNSLINKLQNSNSVSIHIRRDRFSDQKGFNSTKLIEESKNFTNKNIDYINNATKYFNKNTNNPQFFIWTNNIYEIEEFTKKLNISNYTIVNSDSAINDFHLFKFSKHFIVGPSTFHWWGAWLNQNNNKICVRPSEMNPSNNLNFWPDEWVEI
jgi:DNA-binding CsgD family transcriptional regulator